MYDNPSNATPVKIPTTITGGFKKTKLVNNQKLNPYYNLTSGLPHKIL